MTEKSYDTAVSTLWYTNNYGAVLTTFALVRTLETFGKKVIVCDQSPLDGDPTYRAADSLSRRFMANHGIACTHPLTNDKKIQALNDSLDTFVVGSDQVWRWQYTQKQGSYPFLDFVRGNKRKIAVSSSFGISAEERPLPLVEKAKWYLKRFDAVSVREKSGLDILSKVYGVEGEWVLDPVFLCDKKVYDELSQEESTEKSPYLLTYVLHPDDSIRTLIDSVVAEKGLNVINMADAQVAHAAMQNLPMMGNVEQGVTPELWVDYIRHASLLITDSFHGVCFALLFNKPFVCVAPPDRGLARFESLLELVGLQEHLLPPAYTESQKRTALAAINWPEVNARLNAMREKNLAWLQRVLTQPQSEGTLALGDFTYGYLYPQSGVHDRKYELHRKLDAETRRVARVLVPLYLRLKCALLSAKVYLTFNRCKRARVRLNLAELKQFLAFSLKQLRS